MKWTIPIALLASVFLGACENSSNSSTQTPGEKRPGAGTFPPLTRPMATPTPSGPVFLDTFLPGPSNKASLGKCVGFTVVGNGVTFSSDATVNVGTLGTLPSVLKDLTHIKVGSPATRGDCVYTPIYGTAGMQDVTITSGGETWTINGALELDPPLVYHLGLVGGTQLYARDYVTASGANTFESPWDVDIYQIDTTDLYRVYPHLDFFDMSTKSLVPRIEFWNSHWPDSPLGEGALASIFPENGPDWFVVRDVEGKGGPGADYDVGASADQLAWIPDGSGCAGAQPITPGAYHIDDPLLTNAFDPLGAFGCADDLFGTPIHAAGPDATFTVTIPAGKTLRAASYDNHWSQAIYLLPKTAASCAPHPTECLASVGYFGGGNNNLLRFTNDSSTDQDYYLVFDTTAVSGTSDGAFLVNVEILDRR